MGKIAMEGVHFPVKREISGIVQLQLLRNYAEIVPSCIEHFKANLQK
jgi:hypothetical protein